MYPYMPTREPLQVPLVGAVALTQSRNGNMEFLTNEHVERLNQYVPFQPSFAQLYAEYVDTRHSDQLSTKAYSFVTSIIASSTARLIILTGDPGHGKTHLCGQLIKSLSNESDDVRSILKERGDGSRPVAKLPSGSELRIIKDLSELTPDIGAQRLAEALETDGRVTVVCANEGRLRRVVSSDTVRLRAIQVALEHVLRTGQTTSDGVISVVNLNHQSVSASTGKSLTAQALRNWVLDRRKWMRCDSCAARDGCPIRENQRLLSAEDKHGADRRAAVEILLRVAEKTNHVITIRELLIFLAYVITGGLRCKDVHGKLARQKDGWQWNHMFFHLAFAQGLQEAEVQRLSVFRATRLLDPGSRAIRPVDDILDIEAGEFQGRFLPPTDDGEGVAKGKIEQREAAKRRQEMYRYLRRRDFFTTPTDASDRVPLSERLGLQYYADFERVLKAEVQRTETVDIRNTVLCGLEAIQGVRRPPSAGSFAVVDPAFSSHRGNASVVACQVSKSRIRLLSQTKWWQETYNSVPDLADAVDWLDRKVHVTIPDSEGKHYAIDLDCRQFELVCRAARGLVSRTFFQADIRRMVAQLAAVASSAPRPEEITVIVGGRPAQLVIDVGNRIVATDA
jgi:hypothetical protein